MTRSNSNYSFSVTDYVARAIFKTVEAAVSYGAKMNGNKWLFLEVVKRALNDWVQTPTRKNVKRESN